MEPKQTDESAPGCGLNSADTWRKARSASVRSVMPGLKSFLFNGCFSENHLSIRKLLLPGDRER